MKVYCPYCRKNVEYKIEKRKVEEFRSVIINSFENVAVCGKCGNDLYVNEIEEQNNQRIYEMYRKKAGIIKPKDIINLRKKYNISAIELASVLDFEKTSIIRYERGGVPTKSQSDYVKLLIDNEDEFTKKIKESCKKNNISQKNISKHIKRL